MDCIVHGGAKSWTQLEPLSLSYIFIIPTVIALLGLGGR